MWERSVYKCLVFSTCNQREFFVYCSEIVKYNFSLKILLVLGLFIFITFLIIFGSYALKTQHSATLKLKVNENSADIVHVQLDTFVPHASL